MFQKVDDATSEQKDAILHLSLESSKENVITDTADTECCRAFLGPRGPLVEPSMFRPPVHPSRPQQFFLSS